MATRSSTQLQNAVGEENDNGSFCDNKKKEKSIYVEGSHGTRVGLLYEILSHEGKDLIKVG